MYTRNNSELGRLMKERTFFLNFTLWDEHKFVFIYADKKAILFYNKICPPTDLLRYEKGHRNSQQLNSYKSNIKNFNF